MRSSAEGRLSMIEALARKPRWNRLPRPPTRKQKTKLEQLWPPHGGPRQETARQMPGE